MLKSSEHANYASIAPPASVAPEAEPEAEPGAECADLDDMLARIGFGRFHWMVLALCCVCYVGRMAQGQVHTYNETNHQISEGAEIVFMTYLIAALPCDPAWQVTNKQVAWMNSASVIAIACGSPVFGILSDKKGRKFSITASVSVVLVFGLLSGLAGSYEQLFAAQLIKCFAYGAVNQFIPVTVEFAPPAQRSLCAGWVLSLWVLAVPIEGLLALLLLNNYGWRYLTVATALLFLPALLALILWVPETVRYLLVADKREKAKQVLHRVARSTRGGNNKHTRGLIDTFCERAQLQTETTERGSVRQLFADNILRSTLVLCVLWIVHDFTWFGLLFHQTHVLSDAPATNGSQCNPLSQQGIRASIYGGLLEFVGQLLLTFVFIRWFRRLRALRLLLLGVWLAELAALLLFSDGRWVITFFYSLARAAMTALANVGCLYIAELYPTRQRGVAIAVFNAISRLGFFISPLLVEFASGYHERLPTLLFVLTSAFALLTSFGLNVETKYRHLQDS